VIFAGIDVGGKNIHGVIVKNGTVLAKAGMPSGIDKGEAAEQLFDDMLKEAGLKREDIARSVATGSSGKRVSFANGYIPDAAADARAAVKLIPSARTVIDVGAEEGRAIKINAEGKVLDFARNEKCAAGTGTFVEAMAKALEVKVEEMGELSLLSRKEIPINVTCVIFAESEVVSLIHSGVNKVDIAQAIHNAIATRTVSMVRRIGIEKDVVFIGGVAKNVGIAALLGKHLGIEPLIPENPQIAGALGAALIAREKE